jgi:hypothetical protein
LTLSDGRSAWTRWVLPGAAFLSLGGSLLARAWGRGAYYPGWDILGPAHGLYVLSTRPLGQALETLYRGVPAFRYWNSTNSLLYTVVPGALGRVWPSEYWGHWLTLALVLLTFGLILHVAELPPRESWLLCLAWGASPALLSFSVAGYPYATGFLPHALALVIVTSPWLRARPLVSLVMAFLATELSWHVYEAGKTLIVVLVLGALLERRAPWTTRTAWLAASVVQVIRLLVQRGYNVDYVLGGAGRGPGALAAAAVSVLHALLLPVVDVPLLIPLGIVALLFVRRHRWLLIGGAASQLLTVVLATAVDPAAIRPRRFLTTSFYCMTALAIAFREAAPDEGRRSLRRLVIVTALLGGSLWQLADLWLFFRVPPSGRTQPLPFTFSQDDYTVAAAATDLAKRVRREVGAGLRVVMLYNLSSETLADPAGLLERLYLSMGHGAFVRSVLSFGSSRCRGGAGPSARTRYDCLPIHPLGDSEHDLAALAAEGTQAVAYYKKRLAGRRHVQEAAVVLGALDHSFVLRPERDPAPGFGRLRLDRRSGAAVVPVVIEDATEPLPLDLIWMPNPLDTGGRVRISPNGGQPFRYEWSADVVSRRNVAVDLLLGCDGGLRLILDGEPVLDRRNVGLALWRERWQVGEGRHAVRLEYETRGGPGRLLLEMETPSPD